jgi:hypothetical protein
VPSWALRPSAVWLWNRKPFRVSKVRNPIPDRDPLEREADRRKAEKNETSIAVGPRIGFQSALEYHRSRQTTTTTTTTRIRNNSGIKWKQITETSSTTSRKSFRISPNPSFNALSSESNEDEEWNGFSDPGSSFSNNTTEIPNPSISGEPAPTIEALQLQINTFGKEYGFGVVRRNAKSRVGRKQQYVLECDRYGQPRVSRGSNLHQRKSRKCGCKWKLIAEALASNKFY